jgi:hypothetical protein
MELWMYGCMDVWMLSWSGEGQLHFFVIYAILLRIARNMAGWGKSTYKALERKPKRRRNSC